MPATKIACPSCGAGLKLTSPVPAGKKIKCPKCGEPFPVPADEPDTASLKPRVPASASPARGAGAERVAPSRKPAKPPPEEREEEDSRDGDAGAAPRARKRRVEDEERDPEDEPDKDTERAEDEEEDRPRKARKKRPRQKKNKGNPALLWGLIGGGAVLLVAAVAAAVYFLSGPSWKEFRSLEGKFVVDFPGTPRETTENMKEGPAHTLTVVQGGYTHTVMYVDMGPEVTFLTPGMLFEGITAAMGPRIKSKKAIQIPSTTAGQHFDGVELVMEDTDNGQPVTVTDRSCLVGQRLYQVMMAAPRGKENPDRAARFLDSFHPFPPPTQEVQLGRAGARDAGGSQLPFMPPGVPPGTPVIQATQLTQELARDESGTKAKYKDQALVVEGKIVMLAQSRPDEVILAGFNEQDAAPIRVRCFVPAVQLKLVKIRDTVRIRGKFEPLFTSVDQHQVELEMGELVQVVVRADR